MKDARFIDAGIERHALSAVMGDMPEGEFFELADDIIINGQKDAAVLFEGKVLDGWHRYQACVLKGVSCRAIEYQGDNPVAFVKSKNLNRRNLTPSQRAAIVVALNDWRPTGITDENRQGGNVATLEGGRTATNREMAQEAGVSPRTVRDAKVAEKAGFGDEVRSGKKSASQAAAEAKGSSGSKKASPIDRAKQTISELNVLCEQLRQDNQDLIETLEAYDKAALDEDARVVEIRGYQSRINALESQLHEKTQQAAEWQREALALRRKVG